MGRRPKKGLHYYPKDVDYYDDFKIMELMNQYGPIGQTIYDIILSIVYREGYYMEISPDKLAMMVMRIIGNRWVKHKDFVVQVVYYCADIGLLHKDLLQQNIITSAGIQRRYADVTARNKVDKEKYWLLDEMNQAVFSAPENNIKSSENVISVTEMQINDADIPQKKRKEKKSKGECGEPHTLAFGRFSNVSLTDDQYAELKTAFEQADDLIDKVSEYLENSTKDYKNHYALILKIARDDKWPRKKRQAPGPPAAPIAAIPMPDDIREKMGSFLKTLPE